ncbi:MAG: response regulator transcription factor [Clostridia bacterium]|nr:response regulator transcription factor [Clostridia bacterium]
MPRIFVVEDEAAINRLICMNLSAAGYEAVPALDGAEALRRLESGERFDLALLDLMLPGLDGFHLLEPLRARGVPAIFLTASNALEDKLQGLSEGAEDYIVKPFEILELLVRMEKVLERHGASERIIRLGDVEIHREKRDVRVGGRSIALTPILYDLLLLLAKNRNIVLSRERILAEVWGSAFLGESRTVDFHVSQLRRKTGLRIASVPKIGYRLELEP